jgi:hypothetical protein
MNEHDCRAFSRGIPWSKYGGASRDRTDDLIVANDALSQLSYSPVRVGVVPDYFISDPESAPTGRSKPDGPAGRSTSAVISRYPWHARP